jgi:hypothetical protein
MTKNVQTTDDPMKTFESPFQYRPSSVGALYERARAVIDRLYGRRDT